MGDRVLFHVHDGKEVGPCVYGHWSGYEWRAYVTKLANLMADRKGDVAYATARLIGILHEDLGGNLSLGCWNAPHRETYAETLAAIMSPSYSHGDAGVVVIDCRDFSVQAFNGYAADSKRQLKTG